MRILITMSVAVATFFSLVFGSPEMEQEKKEVKPIEKETLALFEYDREADLEIEEVGFESLPGYSRADLTFASPAGGRVPAYLYLPDAEGPHPGIVLMHGMPGDRESSKTHAPRYVTAGAVVLAISAPWARPDGPREEIVTFTEKDYHEQIQLIQDLQRGIDLLLTFDEVDPERLAYIGGSYGGAMGGLLAGVEKRLKAYVLVVGDGGLIAHFTGPDDPEIPRGISAERWVQWKKRMAPIEPIRFVAHASPAHLLFQNGEHDEMVPAVTARVYQEAGSEPKKVLWYNAGHALTPRLLDDHLKWLSERVGLKVEKGAGS